MKIEMIFVLFSGFLEGLSLMFCTLSCFLPLGLFLARRGIDRCFQSAEGEGCGFRRNGPKSDPCGTPEVAGAVLEIIHHDLVFCL